MKEREIWLDYLRAFACILVCIGHLLMSFQESLIGDPAPVSYVIETIYHFHVYLFFFASGYLMQKSFRKQDDPKGYFGKKLLRCADFLIVYVLFTAVTYGIKLIFAGDVNSPVEISFVRTLLQEPINQMWYLYAISIITLCTPPVTKGNEKGILAMAVSMKILMCIPAVEKMIPVPVSYLANHQIWYVLGSLWANHRIVLKKRTAAAAAGVFLLVNTVLFALGIGNGWWNTFLTFTGIVASVGICYACTAHRERASLVWKLIARHMLPIYLLHTIFAAGIRIVLLRLGIANVGIHLVMGLVFSFAVPILCGEIADRIRILNICFYPTKTVRSLLRK